jgi:hypothetical protein
MILIPAQTITTDSKETEQDPGAGAHQAVSPKGNEHYTQIIQRRKDQGEHPCVWMGDSRGGLSDLV